MVIFAIGSQMTYLYEFVEVFGIRFIGLYDPGSTVYSIYRVPRPEAPYPQDFIIDQQGIVRYWADEYNPQEIMRVIDELLATGTGEGKRGAPHGSLDLSVIPNPAKGIIAIETKGVRGDAASITIYDVSGRLVLRHFLATSTYHLATDLPPGIYFIKLQSGDRAITKNVILTY